MLCSTALCLYRNGIVARCLSVRPEGLSLELMRDGCLRVAVRHVSPIRECPDCFRGFTLADVHFWGGLQKALLLILKGIFRFLIWRMRYYIVKFNFTMQMFLRRTRVPHIISPIGCNSSATSAVSSTSSFGGLNPNRSFGFFFARVRSRTDAVRRGRRNGKRCDLAAAAHGLPPKSPQALTWRDKFLYNSELFRIRARGGRTRESLHAPRCAHYKQEKNTLGAAFFLDRS